MARRTRGMGQKSTPAALHVIVLGSGGGPLESNTTAILVRSVAQEWRKGSIVSVDAGVLMSAITRLIQESISSLPSPLNIPHTLTSGPFEGLTLPFKNPGANAEYFISTLVDAFLITHPHLDHVSGMVINTASPPSARPKKVAGLPSTIHALKTHIFNNIIWPNLSDENNGVGLVTFLRLVEGGSPALGDGEGKGYLEICDGLLVKTWGVSHGHCIENHPHRGSVAAYDAPNQSPRISHSVSAQATPRRQSLLSQGAIGLGSPHLEPERENYCVYNSSAYFIQDTEQTREVLIFGDVEPDSISLSPRNLLVWQEAAPKIAAGTLAAVFIECSYDDSQSNDRLFGHLKPFFLIEELKVLAAEVDAVRKASIAEDSHSKKRKRMSGAEENSAFATRRTTSGSKTSEDISVSPKAARGAGTNGVETNDDREEVSPGQLEGLKVVIIHVKDKMNDGPDVGDVILGELEAYNEEAKLGCDFVISKSGQSFYF